MLRTFQHLPPRVPSRTSSTPSSSPRSSRSISPPARSSRGRLLGEQAAPRSWRAVRRVLAGPPPRTSWAMTSAASTGTSSAASTASSSSSSRKRKTSRPLGPRRLRIPSDCGEPNKFIFVRWAAMALGYVGLANLNCVTATVFGGYPGSTPATSSRPRCCAALVRIAGREPDAESERGKTRYAGERRL